MTAVVKRLVMTAAVKRLVMTAVVKINDVRIWTITAWK